MSPRRMWKFGPYEPIAEYRPLMPTGAVIRHFAAVGDALFVWAEVDPAAATEERRLLIIGTGFDIPDGCVYRGTAFEGRFVWHLYEVRPTLPEERG